MSDDQWWVLSDEGLMVFFPAGCCWCVWPVSDWGRLRTAAMWGVNQELWLFLKVPIKETEHLWLQVTDTTGLHTILQFAILTGFPNCLVRFHVFCTTEYTADISVHHVYAEECNGCLTQTCSPPCTCPVSLFMPQCWVKTTLSLTELSTVLILMWMFSSQCACCDNLQESP